MSTIHYYPEILKQLQETVDAYCYWVKFYQVKVWAWERRE